MKRLLTTSLGLAAVAWSAAVYAAPPVDTAPVPQAAKDAVDQTKQTTSDVQKSVDARKDGPASQANQTIENAGKQIQNSAQNAAGQAQQGAQKAADQAQQSADKAADRASQAGNRAADQVNRAADKAANQTQRATDRAADQAERAGDKANQAADRAADKANQATDRAGNTLDRAGQSLENAANKAGQAADRALDRTDQAVDRAADRVNQGIDRAADRVEGRIEGKTQTNIGDNRAAANVRANIDDARINTALGVNWADAADRLVIGNLDRAGMWSSIGLQAQDQIVSIGGRSFTTPLSFYQYASTLPIGQRVPIIVNRNGAQQTLYWTPNQQFAQLFPAGGFAPGGAAQQVTVVPNGPRHFLGIQLDERVTDAAVVAAVTPNSPAARAQIHVGDAILAVNGQAIRGPNDFIDAVAAVPANTAVNLSVSRTHDVELNAGTQSNPVPVTAGRPVLPPDNAPVPATRGPQRRFFRRF